MADWTEGRVAIPESQPESHDHSERLAAAHLFRRIYLFRGCILVRMVGHVRRLSGTEVFVRVRTRMPPTCGRSITASQHLAPMSAMGPGCSLTRGLAVKLSVTYLPGSLFSDVRFRAVTRPKTCAFWNSVRQCLLPSGKRTSSRGASNVCS